MKFRIDVLILVSAGVLAVLMPASAMARPRDDAMSGAFRCAAIGDSRQWLDCYYGAAQPVRAALGMPPAPEAQQRLVTAPPAGPPGDASVRDEVMAGAFRCNALAEERQWLNCYYAAAQPVRLLLGLSPAPQASAAPAPGIPAAAGRLPDSGGEKVPARQFGIAVPPPQQMEERVDHITARMADYKFNKYNIFTVTLANGQVWRQVGGDTTIAHWRKPADTYTAVITRGFLGSFNLQVRNNPGKYKVERVA